MTNSTSAATRAQTEPFHATALGLSLTVKDLARSLKFYTSVLGFAKMRDFERDGVVTGAALRAGDVEISLNQDDGKKGKDRALGQGFSMRLTTEQSIDAIAARVKAAGGKLESEPADMPWGSRIFVIVDPDSYRWVVSSPRK
jgi:lactoylglutathione lyase